MNEIVAVVTTLLSGYSRDDDPESFTGQIR